MKYGITAFGVIPVRKKPDNKAEMISQLLFGEFYHILDKRNDWIKILTLFDNYTGWIDHKLHTAISGQYYHQAITLPGKTLADLTGFIKTGHQPPFAVVAGSYLPCFNESDNSFTIENKVFKLLTSPVSSPPVHSPTIADTSAKMLNSPYLWGGRTPFGFDCSGFTQIVYKIQGYTLPRDAWQQASAGISVESVDKAKTGDLAFFSNKEGQIIHTGIITGKGTIIHSSGYVRSDRIDDNGIYLLNEKMYTHTLCAIRRII